MSKSGKPYGSEYHTVHASGNIKFIMKNEGSATAPMETMTKGRVYATINSQNKIKYITYFDKHNKRYKQIDVIGRTHNVNGVPTLPHIHFGELHDSKSASFLSTKEIKMVDRVLKIWYNYNNGRQ